MACNLRGDTPNSTPTSSRDRNPNCVDGRSAQREVRPFTLTQMPTATGNTPLNACSRRSGTDTLSSTSPGVPLWGVRGMTPSGHRSFPPPCSGSPPVRSFRRAHGHTNQRLFRRRADFRWVRVTTRFRLVPAPARCSRAPGSGVDNVSRGDGDDTFVCLPMRATPGKKLLANGGFEP